MTEQEKREKVIKGLEEVKRYIKFDNIPAHSLATLLIIDDALALLKAQEPRVMALGEVYALDWDYCYLEEERLPGKEYRLVCGEHILTCVTWPSITAAKITYGCDGYGKRWRCWTSRPTDAQREATPWLSEEKTEG